MSNECSDLIKSHRSTRKYKNVPIQDYILNDILTSAQWAPSSHNVQAYSIIVVKNQENKNELSKVCLNQKWVEECPVFLVFCADFYRLKLTSEIYNQKFEIKEIENILVGSIDTALAAENVFLSARSYGLGGVIMGGLRTNPEKVINLLNIPKYVFPLFGMCLGYPAEKQWKKPRLPKEAVIHNEYYRTKNMVSKLNIYENISSNYYTKRTNGRRTKGWTQQMANYFSKPRYTHMIESLLRQGFNTK